MDWRMFSPGGLAEALTESGHTVSERTINRWKAGKAQPRPADLRAIRELVGAQTKDAPPEWARRLTDELKTEIETTRTVVAETLAREIGQSVGADLDRLLSRLLDERAP